MSETFHIMTSGSTGSRSKGMSMHVSTVYTFSPSDDPAKKAGEGEFALTLAHNLLAGG